MKFCFQFTVNVKDSAGRTDSAAVTITVRTNQPPTFTNLPTSIGILETRQSGNTFFTVTANDGDLKVLFHFVIMNNIQVSFINALTYTFV